MTDRQGNQAESSGSDTKSKSKSKKNKLRLLQKDKDKSKKKEKKEEKKAKKIASNSPAIMTAATPEHSDSQVASTDKKKKKWFS